MIYSFNASKLVTVWGGFSTKWYAALLDDSQILTAAWVSLKIAFISASIATVLGTLAAIIMLRFGRFAVPQFVLWDDDRAPGDARSDNGLVPVIAVRELAEFVRVFWAGGYDYCHSAQYFLFGLSWR